MGRYKVEDNRRGMMRKPNMLAFWRVKIGWTQSKLARETGLSDTYIRATESGKEPIPKNKMIISKAMGIPEEELFPDVCVEKKEMTPCDENRI